MTYEESLAYLESLQRFGINLGLARIERLLSLLGNPERQFRSIHIAGTNGKGSTTAMLSSVLLAAGIRTGMYISPHLDDYTERISIDGTAISREEFAAAIERAAVAADQMAKAGAEHPTEFELITAAAFYHFAQAGVEYAVIEAGLGGRIDSTNVIMPEVAVITNVAFEHADKLGPELADIAWHKAGIIKQGRPVVTAAQGQSLSIIASEAAKLSAPLYAAGQHYNCAFAGISQGLQRVKFQAEGCEREYAISLLGRHQAENAGVVLMVLSLLGQTESRLTDKVISDGLRRAVWPGRFEVISGKPDMIVDGAHNPAGAKALRRTLDDVYPNRKIVFVLGILADKDVKGIIDALVRPEDKVIAVKPDSPRAADPAALIDYFQPGQALAAASMAEAVRIAAQLSGPAGVVCVAGSLYQAGAARKAIIAYNRSQTAG